MTLTSPPSMTATTEFVVPRSMPMIFSPSATVVLLSCSKIQRPCLSPVPAHQPRAMLAQAGSSDQGTMDPVQNQIGRCLLTSSAHCCHRMLQIDPEATG